MGEKIKQAICDSKIEYVSFDINLLRAILPVYMVISCSEATSKVQ